MKTSTLLMVLGLVVGFNAVLALLSRDVTGYTLLPLSLILILMPAIGRLTNQGD